MTIILSGGLGNQMFQYALYLALKAKGRNVKLDTSLYFYVKMHNGYELVRCFGIDDPIVKGNSLYIFFLRFMLKFKPNKCLFVDTGNYNAKVFSTNFNYISGYWQSEKYFKPIEDLVRNAFVFQCIDTNNLSLAEEIRSMNSISLHLRRGDYIGNSIYTDECNESYYEDAIKKLFDRLPNKENVQFYVFSDDKAFADVFIGKLNYPVKLIDYNKGADSYKDMYLMSQCKHNIIANSSFSWWGAWLNNNPEKIVIAPKKWFNVDNEDSYKDIVPESWIKI